MLRPGFWEDATMASLPPATRLTYMGLWCLADDAGFIAWHPREIAGQLYRFEPTAEREARVAVELDELVAAGRVRPLECGKHAEIPTIVHHRIKGGEQSYTVRQRHAAECGKGPDSVGIRRDTSGYVSDSVSDSDSFSDSGRRGALVEKVEGGRKRPPTEDERRIELQALIDDPSTPIERKKLANMALETLGGRSVH